MKTLASEIRYAEMKDADVLSRIHECSWRGAYAGLIPHKVLSQMVERRGAAWWARAIAGRAAILVVEFGGEAVGYATLGRNRTRALAVEGEIYEIYLKPEFQGIGFGGRLFDGARSLLAARGLKGVAVWALADNENAVEFYARAGGFDVATGTECFDGVTLKKIAFVWA